jgi:hypothetical protein
MVVPPVTQAASARRGMQRLILKADHVVIAALVAAALLWIEHGHRIVTDAPTSTELDALAAARACPDSENMPYTARCLAFLKGNAASEMRWRPDAAETVSAKQPAAATSNQLTAVAPQVCADTDTVPYTASCIAFMSGWFWRPNSQ